MTRFGRDPFALLIVVLAGLGTAHILVRTATYGAAVSPDSTVYLSTALNFLAGEGWRDFTGEPLTLYPPLFPLLLAAFGWVGIDPLEAGRWVNAIIFGLTILVAGGWLRSNLRSRLLALAATAIIAASPHLSHWGAVLQTESLFFLLTLLALIQLASFLNRKTVAPLWWAAVFTALAAITRYVGVALIGTGFLLLLPLARLRHTVVFGAVSSVPLLAVLAHNWAVIGNLTRATGYRDHPSGQSLSDGLRQTVEVFHKWVVPLHSPDGFGYLLWPAVVTVILASAAAVLRGRRPDPEATPALPFGVFAAIYIVFMVAVVPVTVDHDIDSRYLMPIYVPLLLAAVFLLDRFLFIEAAGWMGAVRHGLAALVGLATLAHIGFSAQESLICTARGRIAGPANWTFNAAAAHWQHSETMSYIRDNPIAGRVYTNIKLAWFWDQTAAPGKYQIAWFWDQTAAPGSSGKSPFSRLAQNRMRWTADGTDAHIVWFRDITHRIGYDVMDIRVLPGLETVAELADGVVFRATAAEPFDADKHRARKERYIEQLIQQAGERVVHSVWDVYRNGRKLTYLKKPCAPADTQAKFVLHVTPADPADLPAYRKRFGYDNLGFYFDEHFLRRGWRRGDQCIAIAQLPDYPIGRIRLGQWISKEDRTVWEAELTPSQWYNHQSLQTASEIERVKP